MRTSKANSRSSSTLVSSTVSTPVEPPTSLPVTKGGLVRTGVFCNKFRFFILVLGTLCLTSVFSNMLTLNFTIICMNPSKAAERNHTFLYPTHNYSQYEKTVLQWTVAIAAAVATFPFSWLCCYYGARWVFFVSGVTSAICTALIPPAASMGLGWFVAVRLFQGLAYACDFAVIGVLCTRWASLRENAKFIAVLTCFSPLASTFTNSVSGVICDSQFGWPYVHYLHGIVSMVLFVAWIIFYTDDPSQNCFVSGKELAVIHSDKSESHRRHERFVPYAAIFKNRVILAVWMNAFADLFSGFFLIIYGPTYIKQVLKYSATETGIAGAIITILHIPVKLTCGWVSDSFHCMAERRKMWIFNSIAVVTPAFIYVYLAFAPLDHPLVTIFLFGAVHAILGFNCGGFYKCGALVSRQYAEFVIAFTQFIKCIVFFVAPALVAFFVSDESDGSQWHMIFYLIAGWLILANSVFCVYATDQPAEFTQITKQSHAAKKGAGHSA